MATLFANTSTIPPSWAPPTADSNYRSQIGSNLGVSGPVAKDAFGNRSLTEEEQRYMFFGPPLRDVKQDPYAAASIENQILPDAWVGKNNYIRQFIFNQIRGDKSVWVDQLLPWRNHTGGNVVNIKRLIFDQHMLDVIPEQGVGRLVTSHYDTQTQNLERRGLMFLMEDGFALTPEGREQYAFSIMQIKMATIETFCFLAALAILNAPPRPANLLQAYHMPLPIVTWRKILEHESTLWSILTAAKDGFSKMQDYGRLALRQHNVDPDVMILPEGTPMLYKYIHPEETDYSKAGPMGPVYKQADGGPIMGKAKMQVIQSRAFSRGERDVTRDPFVRERSKGTFFQICHQFIPQLAPGQAYPLDCQDTTLLDGRHDALRPISYWEAFEKSLYCRSNETGNVAFPAPTLLAMVCASDSLCQKWAMRCQGQNALAGASVWNSATVKTALGAPPGTTDDQLRTILKTLGAAVDNAGMISALVMAAAEQVLLSGAGAKPTVQSLKTFASKWGVPMPFNFLLFRPHEVYNMGSGVMMKKGASTGSTYLGNGDFELGRDANRKMLQGFYTVYGGPIIERPEQIHVLHNVVAVDYIRGESIRIYDANDDQEIKNYQQGRLTEHTVKDIFVIPMEQPLDRDHLDITGAYPREAGEDTTRKHYNCCQEALKTFSWRTPAVYMDSMRAFTDPVIYNTRCWQGTQYFWGIADGGGGLFHSMAGRKTGSKAQFGGSIYAGVMADRVGRGQNSQVIPLVELDDGAREVVARL